MRVEIQNFQAIAHSSFEIDGFTAMVGRSNIGKSAVIRALKCALTGAGGTDFVRHDPKNCDRVLKGNKACKCFSAVTLFFDNGDKLLWEKGDKKNQYTTWSDGEKQEYTRVGKNPEMPPMLQGFDPIKLGDRNRELVQVADQFDGPVFLLNVPGPTVADLLSDVAQLDDINKAMRLVTRDRKEASATRKVREKDIKDIDKNLKVYTGLDNTALKVVRAQEAHVEILNLTASVKEAARFLQGFASLAVGLRGLKVALQPDLPDDEALAKSEGSLILVNRFLKTYRTKAGAIKSLSGVEDIEIPDVLDANRTLDTLGKVDSWTVQLKGIKATVSCFNTLSKLPLADEPPEKFSGVSQLGKLDGFKSELDELEEDIEALESELEEVTSELDNLHEEYAGIDSCPVCSQEMPPHLLTEAVT